MKPVITECHIGNAELSVAVELTESWGSGERMDE